VKNDIYCAILSTILGNSKPDPSMTPGRFCNPKNAIKYVRNVPICKRNVSTKLRNKVFNRYGIHHSLRHLYTIDHLFPVALSGSNSIKNLWPMPRAMERHDIEHQIINQFKSGFITHSQAVILILELKGVKL
jgi:hypothetical protein